MKKILVLIIALFTAIVVMAYLYFNGLNADQKDSDSSLYAATLNSAMVLSFQNDKSIIDILSSQGVFREITGENKYAELESIKKYLVANPTINKAVEKQAVFISLIPNGEKDMDFLYTTQLNTGVSKDQLTSELKLQGIKLSVENDLIKISLPDSNMLFFSIKENVLILSSNSAALKDILKATLKSSSFSDYIKANSRVKKNSLAELYVNFEALPHLLKTTMPGKLNGQLSGLDKLNAFASLSYNFSREKMLLSGVTTVAAGNNYQKLFDQISPIKISITNILPENTANYSIFAITDYTNWSQKLQNWFQMDNEEAKRKTAIESYNQKYRINLNQVFPKYFKDQLMTFQLSSSEKLGAISLSNGEKLSQLLLDFSTEYSPEIKSLQEDDLLYYYFGEPFKTFRRPFYCIIDNYMVFANNASTIQSFLSSYKNDRLLINDSDYIAATNQLASTANISYYVGFKNSIDLFRRNLHFPYYRQLRSDQGMKSYTTFIYQLSGDNGKFQTNVLMTKKPVSTEADSLVFPNDSLISVPEKDN